MTEIPAVNVGDLPRLGNHTGTNSDLSERTAFNIEGEPTDPTAVTLTINKPTGVVLTYGWPAPGANGSLTREEAGRFFTDVLLDQPGRWVWKLTGTGLVQASTGDLELWAHFTKV